MSTASAASSSDGRGAGAAFEDFGAVAVAILGSAGAAAGVKALFGVIETAVEQAYQTRRGKARRRTTI